MSRGKDEAWTTATRKKPAKPRPPPVAELTGPEREARADESVRKAIVHLSEAEAMVGWGEAPNACVHAAYYAMHFIAVAALFRAGGVGKHRSVPESHEHVLRHYIALAERQDAPLRDTGRTLNRARDMRVQCDYFPGEGSLSDGFRGTAQAGAADIVAAARSFLENWTARWSV